MSDFERCKKYKPSIDRVCELSLVDRYLWCDGCFHFKQPDDCGIMQRQSDIDTLLSQLGKFPPYHGEGYNYTKMEVEDWLAETKEMLRRRRLSFGGKPTQ